MSVPLRYGEHLPVTPGTPCNVCAAKHTRPVVDHCHAHGWVRETLCPRCNTLMALIDRKISPRAGEAGQATLLGLLMHYALCPDCPPLTIDELGATRSLCSWNREPPSRATTALIPSALADRIREIAAAENEDNMTLTVRKLLTEALKLRDDAA